LRRIIREEKEINPARILAKLSAFVKTTLQQDTNNAHSDDGLDAAICCYNPETDTLEFAGARLPLFVARDGILKQIKGDRESLGYISTRAVKDFTLHAIQPASGNHFYMVTDGFSDQLGVKDSERFGNQRFRNLIAEHHQKPFSEQKIMLTNALSLHKGEADQTDDITIVGFRL
jgi:serine phosphatase RsbU (regulator of sigma subunit)